MPLKTLNSNSIRGELYRVIEENVTNEHISSLSYVNLDSDQYIENYKFLGDIPEFREWVGSRYVNQLEDYGLTIKNKKHELTLSVEVDEIDNDKTAQVQARIDMLANASPRHWENMLTDLINAGTTARSFDGEFFFDTDHKHDFNNSAISNKINISLANVPVPPEFRGTLANPSPDTMAFAMIEASKQLMKFKSDRGRSLNRGMKNIKIYSGIDQMSSISGAVSSTTMTYGRDNPIKATGLTFDTHIDPDFAIANSFVAVRTDHPGIAKPFILQQMGNIKRTEQTAGSKLEHDEDRWEYGLKAWRGGGYGLWQQAVLVTITA